MTKHISTTKYEIIQINNVDVTVDVSLLIKNDELFFNATEMSKGFEKRKVQDYVRLESTQKYVSAIKSRYGISRNELIVSKRGGRYQGTWMHKKLALDFARWLDPMFAVLMDEWVVSKLKEEQTRKQARLEARTGYLPMTTAIMSAHDPAKFYHFSTEADLLNKIVTGLSAKKFKAKYGTDSVRDYMTAAQVQELEKLQRINAGLIEIGMPYEERKDHLIRLHDKEMRLLS